MKIATLILVLVSLSYSSFGQSDQETSELYENTVKALVTVVTPNAIGSGFFIGDDLLVTNYHVVEGEDFMGLKFIDKDEIETILGYVAVDKENDLIILKSEKKYKHLIKLEINEPKPGTQVFAFGSPKGLEATMSKGMISALRNDTLGNLKYIQHDAPISPGNSGGPLLNATGKLLGVNVSKVSGENLNFAIPASALEELSYNMSFLKNFPVEGESKSHKREIESSFDYEKRALEMVHQLGDMIEIIADKKEEETIRKEAVNQAVSLFVTPESIIEVSNINSNQIKKIPANNYFIRLYQLPFTEVQIEWSELAFVSDFKPGPDGKLYALISVSQKFTGINDNKVTYTDITIKHIEVMIDKIEGAWGTSYKVYLNSLFVVNTI